MSLEIERMVAEGRVDFGLVVREPQAAASGCTRIGSLPLYCVMPADHPLASRAEVTPADVAALDYVSLGQQFTVGGATARMLAAIGSRYAPAIEVMHFSTACAFVRHSGRVAILDALARFHAPELGLAARPITGAPSLQLDLLWSPTSGVDAHARHFAAGLERALSEA